MSVYLDPMYTSPDNTKRRKAAVKKETQFLHRIVQFSIDDSNSSQNACDGMNTEHENNSALDDINNHQQNNIGLMKTARKLASKKIVVKRAISAPVLGQIFGYWH